MRLSINALDLNENHLAFNSFSSKLVVSFKMLQECQNEKKMKKFKEKENFIHTFLMSCMHRRPQPRFSHLHGSASIYILRWKRWLLHLSPAGQVVG